MILGIWMLCGDVAKSGYSGRWGRVPRMLLIVKGLMDCDGMACGVSVLLAG